MVRLTERLCVTIVVDWDVKPQNKHTFLSRSLNKTYLLSLNTFITESFNVIRSKHGIHQHHDWIESSTLLIKLFSYETYLNHTLWNKISEYLPYAQETASVSKNTANNIDIPAAYLSISVTTKAPPWKKQHFLIK